MSHFISKPIATFKKDSIVYNFLLFLIFFSLSLSIIIYFREASSRSRVSFLSVLAWQSAIWIPWVLVFPIFNKIIGKFRALSKYGMFGMGLIWVSFHFLWFFFLSSNYSPYVGFPGSGYGVYPYFFIFWSIFDVILIWIVIGKLEYKKTNKTETEEKALTTFEFSRGNRSYLCDSSKIYFLSADNYYTKFHTQQGVFLVRKPLKLFSEKLYDQGFRRIHRSSVVNMKFVSEIQKESNGTLKIILKDGYHLKVSRSYSKGVRLFLKNYTS